MKGARYTGPNLSLNGIVYDFELTFFAVNIAFNYYKIEGHGTRNICSCRVEILHQAWKSLGRLARKSSCTHRDVTAGVTAVAPKFLDTLTLFQPGGQILPRHCRKCTKNFPLVTSLTQKKFPAYLCVYYLLFCPDKFATTQNFFISTNNLHN